MQSQWPSRLFSMKEELLRGKRYREMQLMWGSEPAYFRTTVHFFLRFFFLAKLILQCPWKLHHANFFRCKTWVCLCQLTEKSQDPLGLSLEVKKKIPPKNPPDPFKRFILQTHQENNIISFTLCSPAGMWRAMENKNKLTAINIWKSYT